MFLKRFSFLILLFLLTASYLNAQDVQNNSTILEPTHDDINVTGTKLLSVTEVATTAAAVLIVEDFATTTAPVSSTPVAQSVIPKTSKSEVESIAVTTTTISTTTTTNLPESFVTTKAPEGVVIKTSNAAEIEIIKAQNVVSTLTTASTMIVSTTTVPTATAATTTASTTAAATKTATVTIEKSNAKPLSSVKIAPKLTAKSTSKTAPEAQSVVTRVPDLKAQNKANNKLSVGNELSEDESDNFILKDKTETDDIATNKNESDASQVAILEPNGSIHTKNVTDISTNELLTDKRKLINDFMPDNIRNNGGIVVHILLLIYACLALGIICDAYFLSSLEFISKSLNIPSDIAGATFMAIGTSAPELFTSLIGIFVLHDDIGTGTILGSAVFNLIFIPAVCGFVVWKYGLQQPKISKYCILRDCLFYFVTITTLLLVLKDNEVDWVESLCMLGLFMVYLIIMYYNAKIGNLVKNDSEQEPLLSDASISQNKVQDWQLEKNQNHNQESELSSLEHRQRRYSIVTEEGDVQENSWINSSTLLKVVMFPAMILFKITLPKPTKLWFPITFIISIVWISILTYISVYLVDIIGSTFGLPETVGGLTILAAGTSFPELISSTLVVKRAGLADMALCNSFGSNIFDILVCLGLPWFMKSLIAMFNLGTLDLVDTMVPIQSMGLSLTTFSLLITIILFLATLSCFKWRLNFGVGLTCLILYIFFITLATVNEIILN